MRRSVFSMVFVLLLAVVVSAHTHGDGLITKLPDDGTWASYDVATTIVHPDGSRTSSTGILVVRSVGKTSINNRGYRWLEFEHSWEEESGDKTVPRYHCSIQKFAIDQSGVSNSINPTMGILTGFESKTSANEEPKNWEFSRFKIMKPGLGSKSGLGLLDYYIRAPFDHATEIGRKKIAVAGEPLECIGVEQSTTTHKLGNKRQDVTTTASRQWANDSTPFGVVSYQFEVLRMDGSSFEQHLTLQSTGENAITSLPNAK